MMPRKTPMSLWRNPHLSHWVPISRIWFQEQHQYERLKCRPEFNLLLLEPSFQAQVEFLEDDFGLVNWNTWFDPIRDAVQSLAQN